MVGCGVWGVRGLGLWGVRGTLCHVRWTWMTAFLPPELYVRTRPSLWALTSSGMRTGRSVTCFCFFIHVNVCSGTIVVVVVVVVG
jgi:hypothetical protein